MMINSLPFEWFILLLRVLFIFLLYFFLFQLMRVLVRELQAAASGGKVSRPTAEMSGHLLVKDPGNSGLRSGARLRLEPVTVIGRHPRATIRLDDSFVSSEHAQVAWNDGQWWVMDLGSTNGTLLNGRPVDGPTELRVGDVIEIGDVRLQLAP